VRAALHTAYGPADLLQVTDVEKPVPKQQQVLIKIRATTVSTGDCNIRNLTFVPHSMAPMAKLMFGIGKPWRRRILGTQLAGEVEAVGQNVTRFKVGDRVFASTGMAGGGHAQYACLREDASLAIKPASLSWEDAVAIPFGANTALYYLRDLGKIRAGQELLVVGASGSIGTAAVQLAKHFGASVTGVCSGQNADLVRSLGADEVIDYTRKDFTRNKKTYDLILDTVAATTFSSCKQSLTPDGIFLPCIMSLTDMLFRMPWTALTRGRRLKGGVAIETLERLNAITEFAAAGTLKPVVDRSYPLERIAEAFTYVERGHKKGNVVITVEHPEEGVIR
jgi:NADPH:quinone reductase-like Zn-dependent oxidoreductase